MGIYYSIRLSCSNSELGVELFLWGDDVKLRNTAWMKAVAVKVPPEEKEMGKW